MLLEGERLLIVKVGDDLLHLLDLAACSMHVQEAVVDLKVGAHVLPLLHLLQQRKGALLVLDDVAEVLHEDAVRSVARHQALLGQPGEEDVDRLRVLPRAVLLQQDVCDAPRERHPLLLEELQHRHGLVAGHAVGPHPVPKALGGQERLPLPPARVVFVRSRLSMDEPVGVRDLQASPLLEVTVIVVRDLAPLLLVIIFVFSPLRLQRSLLLPLLPSSASDRRLTVVPAASNGRGLLALCHWCCTKQRHALAPPCPACTREPAPASQWPAHTS
mmetsp:Transcript_19435/g.74619  ORF Transcript_19435/g.74619 Transcript_19435/m.74619 type:complete len:273 (+) Transcript_19435:224-1042(+)